MFSWNGRKEDLWGIDKCTGTSMSVVNLANIDGPDTQSEQFQHIGQ